MKKIFFMFAMSVMFVSNIAMSAGAFGPRENKLIFNQEDNSIIYRIDNTDKKMPWLVQAWVEEAQENRTNIFTTVPMVFRVEPSSQFSARVIKKGSISDDKESLFWVVSNAIPGGTETKSEKEDDKINAKINLAYRYKVPMFYRPASLKNIKQEPESLKWTVNSNGQVKVYNPSRFYVQLNYVSIDGERKQGDGVTYMLSPMSSANVKISAKKGKTIKYGVVNDFGAVNEYPGIVN